MVKKSELKRNTLDELLEWLDPDRQIAGKKYEEIRRALVKILAWRKCADAEGMADEVIDRVAGKIETIKKEYKGNPQRYFFGVARNLLKEYQKTLDIHVSLTDLEIANKLSSARSEGDLERKDFCLRQCLQKLTEEQRQQIINYYGGEKQLKIRSRKELAQDLGIGQNTLRVRMYRLRANLETCIEKCLERSTDEEME
jgi:RNA polymerase sigma factor (sigma-70 family)